jgi:Asp/Glu/hydantoin racemase
MSMRLRDRNPRVLESGITVSFRHREFQLREAHAVVGMSAAEGYKMLRIGTRAMLKENGAEAIMLGGTDLALAFSQQDTAFPLVDCAAIHVDAIVRLASS